MWKEAAQAWREAEPRFSWRLIAPPYDVLDAGTGLGVYWFVSDGFDTFGGLMVEPIRIDLHGPTSWLTCRHKGKRLWGALHGSLGVVLFPGGFPSTAFNATGEAAREIPGGEAVLLKAITLDVLALFRTGK